MVYLLDDYTDCDSSMIVAVWGTLQQARDYADVYIEKHYPNNKFVLLAIYEREFGPEDSRNAWCYIHNSKKWMHIHNKRSYDADN